MKNLLLILLFLTSSQLFAQKANDILGKWTNEKQTRTIEIYENNDLYYGKVVWLKDSEKGKGNNRLDIKNHNTALENRKILGVDFLLSFAFYTDRKVWRDGQIYNYETGNTYTGKMTLNENGEIELTGYYGILWFLGRTQILKRAK